MGSYYWSPGMTLKHMEEEFVKDALKFYNGSEQTAANSLGITLEKFKEILQRCALASAEEKKREHERVQKSAEFLARSRGQVYVDPVTQVTLVKAYDPKEGLGSLDAAAALAQSDGMKHPMATPESAVPLASVLPTAGDPVAAAKKTQMLMQEHNS